MTINPGQVGGEDHRQTEWNELWLAASTTISDDVAASLMYADAWGVETLAPHANHFLPRLEDEPARVFTRDPIGRELGMAHHYVPSRSLRGRRPWSCRVCGI